MEQLARDVAVIKTLVSNAYLVGDAKRWILVDALTPGQARTIKQSAEIRFGPAARPLAIVLTHGHPDHAGSAAALADFWDVKVYAHRLERPYLTGMSSYPPLDHTAPGFFSGLSRFMPAIMPNLGSRVAELDADRPLPWLEEWNCHFTPGHSPGHVSFFRPNGSILLAGDAVTTMNLDSLVDTITQRQRLCRPPVPSTMDWQQARDSAERLARLGPVLICAGHGKPMLLGTGEFEMFVAKFPVPTRGRYAKAAAVADERGIQYLPPAPFDPLPKLLAIGACCGIGFALLRKRGKKT